MNLELNTAHVKKVKEKAGFEVAAFYLMLLAETWSEKQKYWLPEDMNLIAKEIGASSETAKVNFYILENNGLTKTTLHDLSLHGKNDHGGDFVIEFPYLKSFALEIEDAKKTSERLESKKDALVGGLSAKSIVRARKSQKDSALQKSYRTKDFDMQEHFKGWLPTSLYSLKGEVAVLSKDYISSLEARNPSKDIKVELNKMLQHFLKKPSTRKSFSKLPEYIENWVADSKETLVDCDLEEAIKCL